MFTNVLFTIGKASKMLSLKNTCCVLDHEIPATDHTTEVHRARGTLWDIVRVRCGEVLAVCRKGCYLRILGTR